MEQEKPVGEFPVRVEVPDSGTEAILTPYIRAILDQCDDQELRRRLCDRLLALRAEPGAELEGAPD